MSGPRDGEVLIIAAEASSSLYAKRLLQEWKTRGLDVHAFGIGSRDMEDVGFERLGKSEDLAVVGLQEVIAHFPLIKKTFEALVDAARVRKPKFALLLDYPDFNLRLAKKLKALGVPVVYYISPQVWAWRTGRVKTIRRVVDHMFVLFPFEEPFYKQHDVKVDFVGHPLLDELSNDLYSKEAQAALRKQNGLDPLAQTLGLMPGSRRSEIKHHLDLQLEAAELLKKKNPHLQVALMIAPSLSTDLFRERVSRLSFEVKLVKTEPNHMIAMSDLILCASGTATLMVGLLEKPMVIMYRMTALTAFFAKRLVNKTPFFGLVNLIMEERVVPELFQEQASPERMAAELERYLREPAYHDKTVTRLKDLKAMLGSRGATRKVADLLQSYFKLAAR